MTTRAEPPAGQPTPDPYPDPLTGEQKEQLYRRLAAVFPDMDPADYRAKPYPPSWEGGVWVPGAGLDLPLPADRRRQPRGTPPPRVKEAM